MLHFFLYLQVLFGIYKPSKNVAVRTPIHSSAMSFPSTELNVSPHIIDGSPQTSLPTNLSATAPRHPAAELPSSNPRSCVTCRRRKVRCNKRSPCSNCTRAGIDCVFPPPGRAPRKSKRPPDAELLSRLRRLEGVIDHLRVNGNSEATPTTSAQAPPSATETLAVPSETITSTSAPTEPENNTSGDSCPFENSDPKKPAPNKFENEFGRLVIDEGRSRYVSNRLWASLGDEVGHSFFFSCGLVLLKPAHTDVV